MTIPPCMEWLPVTKIVQISMVIYLILHRNRYLITLILNACFYRTFLVKHSQSRLMFAFYSLDFIYLWISISYWVRTNIPILLPKRETSWKWLLPGWYTNCAVRVAGDWNDSGNLRLHTTF